MNISLELLLTDFFIRLTVLHLSVADLPSDTLTSGEPVRSMYGDNSAPGLAGFLPKNYKCSKYRG